VDSFPKKRERGLNVPPKIPAPDASDIIIRHATRADLPTVGRLGALLVETHHDFDPKRFIPATRQTAAGYATFIGSQLEQPDVIVLVAERGAEVIGYAYAGVEGRDWVSLRGRAGVLHDIVIDPERRQHGVGRMLLDAMVAALRSRGAPQIVLWTAARNESAQRLFASAGFRATMVEMTRDLDGEG
jgi:ribosomal protein S18 acetylase RimI-like enzyme